MLLRNTIRTAIAGAVLLGSWGIAHAVPTATVDGITFPVGLVPGGNQIQSGILAETLITAPGQVLSGVGIVNSISDTTLGQTWGNGQNGIELAFAFTNFTATSVLAPTTTVDGTVRFSGGALSFYTLPAGTPITGLGSVAANIAAVQSGTLWLAEAAPPENAAGDTLIATIPHNTTLVNFSAASGQGFLDVAGGPAASFFSTRSFANAADPGGGASDVTFTSDFSSSSTNGSNFGVNGSATLKANANTSPIPEPMSLGVLGLGMLAVGVARRRKR